MKIIVPALPARSAVAVAMVKRHKRTPRFKDRREGRGGARNRQREFLDNG